MISWSEVLRSRLGLPFFHADDVVPFGLPPVPDDAWTVDRFREDGDRWRLDAHSRDGLEAVWFLKLFADTRAAECWGEVTNRGSEPVADIVNAFTLDVALRVPEALRRPWIRGIDGVGPRIKSVFPPRDFSAEDVQLAGPGLLVPSHRLGTTPGGRSTGDHLPIAIIGDEHARGGLALMLEWSGQWTMTIGNGPDAFSSRAPQDRDRLPPLELAAGIDELRIDVAPGESLPLPRLLIAAYDGDLDAGGNAIRRHIRRHVTPRLDGDEVLPPTSFNHWFAFGNDYTASSMKAEVDASVMAGLEYFCIDGGWFRGDFPDGVGNWDDGDPAKFPGGIKPFADYVTRAGIKYGTWFEPERATRESDLYLAHPDWFWPTPDGAPHERRTSNEAHIDFGRAEARAWWVERIIRAHDDWGVRWIRWDYNIDPRPNWDSGVEPGRHGRRQIDHVLGLYRVLDEILEARPGLFIEQCASGGFRIDLGTVRRGHSFWMNDATEQSDLVRAFQHGLNQVLPGNYANTNLCQPRHDFTCYDFLSHSAGGYGYSGRLSQAPKEDFARYARSVADFKRFRHLLLGRYERPTGQPRRMDDHAKVVFSDGGEALTMEFNVDGPGTAGFTVD